MHTEDELWREIRKASEMLSSLARFSNDAMNRYRGIPAAGSTASKELSQFADPSVLQEAYGKGSRSLVVACDYALALDRTLSNSILSYSPWAGLRHILESCSLCIWMLDTSISALERATRSLNVQFTENRSKRTFLQKDSTRNASDAQQRNSLIANTEVDPENWTGG